jgi:hypothetical protein
MSGSLYSDFYHWMDLLEFKNIILEVKLSNEFKKVRKKFLKVRNPRNSQKLHNLD